MTSNCVLLIELIGGSYDEHCSPFRRLVDVYGLVSLLELFIKFYNVWVVTYRKHFVPEIIRNAYQFVGFGEVLRRSN